MFLFRIFVAILIIGFTGMPTLADDATLSKESQNPVGDIISLPIEYWHYDGIANGSSVDALLLKPVYPARIGRVNLINRLIILYLGVEANVNRSDLGDIPAIETNRKNVGLGNIQYQGFITPTEPGKIIWGLGPALELPTNTSGLGSDKWSAGGAGVVLSMPGNWVLGALLQNVWSFTGSNADPDVNKLTFQYFINYNISNGWYLTMTPTITADWEKPSGSQWTIPVGGGIGKLHRFGKLPVDFKLQAYTNVEKPTGGPEWSMMFAVKLLFPK